MRCTSTDSITHIFLFSLSLSLDHSAGEVSDDISLGREEKDCCGAIQRIPGTILSISKLEVQRFYADYTIISLNIGKPS